MLHLLKYRRSRAQEASAHDDEQAEFSLARFEPMGRLLSQEDFDFLKTQPGYTPEIGKRFTRDRRRIFRLYLEGLALEFHRLHASARAMAAALPSENAALIGILLRQQVHFWYQVTAIELHLSLGLSGAGSDARGLIDAIGRMQAEIHQLAAPAAA